MKISTRGQYGLHAMFDLAQHAGEGAQPLKAIAQRQHLPDNFLEQLLGALRKEGLVRTMRGAAGGYELARAPSEISVGQVLRALEGPLAPIECLAEEGACERSCGCATRVAWQRMQNGLNSVVDSITLAHMLEDDKKLNGDAREGEKVPT